jgi:hypothetical protein
MHLCLLDEATAAAEGMAMARRVAPSQASTFFVDHDCHPQTVAVIQTRAEPLGWTVVVGDPAADLDPASVFGAILQYPGSPGGIRDYRDVIRRLHAAEASAIVAADPLALTLLMSPGELGADIAVGSTQRFGVPMGYGGPHAGFIAAKSAFQRALPGRIVGLSVRQPRASGLPAGATDPRAAHPARKGDFKHLHRAGAAGGPRLDVRRLSRGGRAASDRFAGCAHSGDLGARTSKPRLGYSGLAVL